jgi:hypothetical protein
MKLGGYKAIKLGCQEAEKAAKARKPGSFEAGRLFKAGKLRGYKAGRPESQLPSFIACKPYSLIAL